MEKFKYAKLPLMLAILGTSVVITGCASIHDEVDKSIKKSDEDIKQIIGAYKPTIASTSLVKDVTTVQPLVSKVKSSWVSVRKPMDETYKTESLPEVFYSNFINNTPGTTNILDLLNRIQREKNIQIRMASEVFEELVSDNQFTNNGGTASSTNLPPLPSSPSLPQSPSSPSFSMNGVSNSQNAVTILSGNTLNNIIYNGTLIGFLDLLANKMQLSWKYQNGQVLLYRYDTRVFNVKALAGTGKFTSGISGSSQSSASASGSSQSSNTGTSTQVSNRVDLTINTDLWKSIQDSIKIMLSPYGQKNFHASADLGTIIISDEPSRLDRVNTYLTKLNKDLSKQVAIHIAIYNIEIDNSDTVGIDWSSIWRTANSDFSFTHGGLTNTNDLQKANVLILRGPWTNTAFTLGALNKVGKASLITRGQIMTMNRQSTPLQIIDETTYLARTTVTVSGETPQVSLEPGTVTHGFSTTITPKIEDDGDVLLNFTSSLSDLKEIVRFDSGTSTIQLPRKSVRDFLQRVKLRSGETLALTGFEQTKDVSDDRGVGDSKNLLFGGKQFAQGKRQSIVILVTPYAIE